MSCDIDARVGGDWVYVGSATEEMLEDGTVPGGVYEIIREMEADAWRYRDGTDVLKRVIVDDHSPAESTAGTASSTER